MKIQYKIFLLIVLVFSLIILVNVANDNYTKIKVNLMLSTDCRSCENELKKSLYEDKYFETYVKNKGWVKSFIQTTSKQKTTYLITLRKPIFKIKNNIYYDQNFNQFFMPHKFNLPTLHIKKEDLKDEILNQAQLIKKELINLKSLNYSNLSGWQIITDKAIVKLGKVDISERVKLLNKITNNLRQSNSNVINLDLIYQQGYVLKI